MPLAVAYADASPLVIPSPSPNTLSCFSSIGLRYGVDVPVVSPPPPPPPPWTPRERDLAVSNPSSSDFCRCRNALLTAALSTLFPFLNGLVVADTEGRKDDIAVGGESGTAVAVDEEELEVEVEVEERRADVGQRRLLAGL